MPKKYKYIWNDPQKKWWVAEKKEDFHKYYFIDGDDDRNNVHCQWVENEPTIWEEIKEEDVFEKTRNETTIWIALKNYNWQEYSDSQKESLNNAIKKHLWITKEEIEKYIQENIYCDDIKSMNDGVKKLFSDRGLLIE